MKKIREYKARYPHDDEPVMEQRALFKLTPEELDTLNSLPLDDYYGDDSRFVAECRRITGLYDKHAWAYPGGEYIHYYFGLKKSGLLSVLCVTGLNV